jgi:hypothetical protein
VEAGEVETGIGPVFSFELLLVKWKSGLASFQPNIFAGDLLIIFSFLSLVFAEVVYRHKDNARREEERD